MVRGMKINEALNLLKFTPKKGAKIIYKVVQSAASNAKNNFKQSIDDLVITKILVTKGPTYKRSLPISRGRVHPIRKRTSHITVEVGMLEGEEVLKKEEKASDESKNTSTGSRNVKEEIKKEEKKSVKKEKTKEKE